jgi:hypothetical protein
MAWESGTVSNSIFGTSAMGGGTALSRTLTTSHSNATNTGFVFSLWIGVAVGSSTYNLFPPGTFGNNSYLIYGLSFVPAGGFAPDLIADRDNSSFIFTAHLQARTDRQTINTAGGSAYQDLFTYYVTRSGRIQLRADAGGTYHMHIYNTLTSTRTVAWECDLVAPYASYL